MRPGRRIVATLALSVLVSTWAACDGKAVTTPPGPGADGSLPPGTSSGSSGGSAETGTDGTSPDGTPPDGSTPPDGTTSLDGAEDGSVDADAASSCAVADGASVLGMVCPVCAYCCDFAWSTLCLDQGGSMERCVWGGGCEGLEGTCSPPPPQETGKFRCAAVNCNVGTDVCVHHALQGDGCESHYCQSAPTGCTGCACFPQSGSSGGSGGSGSGGMQVTGRTQDSAGNVTITALY